MGKVCRDLIPHFRHVHLDPESIDILADNLAGEQLPLPAWDHPAFPPTAGPILDGVVWLGNALNFCYWVPEGEKMWSIPITGQRVVDAFALFGLLNSAYQNGHDLSDASVLKSDIVGSLFASGQGYLPLVEERIRILHKIGHIIEKNFAGRLENAIAAAGNDALLHAGFLAATFPSFNDFRTLDGTVVPLCKRAQLAAGMLHAARLARGAEGLINTDQLTVYADYMLPVALRSLGVLLLKQDLSMKIDEHRLLEAGSREETEIRVATVAACDLLIESVGQKGGDIDTLRLDYWLWRKGFENESPIPHHRSLTTDY